MSDYGTILYTGPLGPTNFYTGTGSNQLQSLDFYRTETDGDYVFHWTFLQSFISPALANLDYILQLDLSPTFNLPTSFETTTEVADNIIASGYSRSAAYADINVIGGWTLILNIDGDGPQTIILAGNTFGVNVAADIQTKVRALTAFNLLLQPSYANFTAVYSAVTNTYTLTSGGIGINSTVVVLGGTAASHLLLGLNNGGYQVRGNTFLLNQLPGGILTVTDSTGVTYTDVSATTNNPGSNQFVASLPFGQITFNSANLPDIVTIVYFPSTSGPIFDFQNGNVEKGFTVPVPPRVASAPVTFYARVAIKQGLSIGPWSSTLTVLTIPNVINETFSRLMLALPDFHVYPTDDAFRLSASLVNGLIPTPLPVGLSNIAKVYLSYATEFDLEYLEKENAIRDVRQDRQRDARLGSILGALYKYPQPNNMQNVDYRLILSNMKAASLDGATYEAVKLVGSAFTGVDPTIRPISAILNFITAGFNGVNYPGIIENITVASLGFMATLSSGVANDPLIPGSLISGPVVSVTDIRTVPAVAPFIVTLSQLAGNVPAIAGYTFVTGAPAVNQFNVNFASPGKSISGATPATTTAGLAFNININGDGFQSVTIGAQTTGAGIAAAIQAAIRSLPAITPFNQAAINTTTVIYTTVYTVTSGAGGLNSSVVITGAGIAPLKLGLANGGTETGPATTLTFNSANASAVLSISYIPNYGMILPGETLIINIDGLGPQTITLLSNAADDFLTTKTGIALAIQTAVRALGSAPLTTSLALLASSTITNSGTSHINGDVDLTPGSSVTGFPPGIFSGTLNIDNAAAVAAMTAAQASFTAKQTLGLAGTVIPSILDGQTLTPGAYKFTSGAATLAASGAGALTLNGAGTYIIYTGSTLGVGAGGVGTISLTGGATAANVYWVVGSSATLNGPNIFNGSVIAQASISQTGAAGGVYNGQWSALTGAITIANATTVNGSSQAVSPSESTVYSDFIAVYDPATDRYTLISGNQHPTATSTVVVTGGTAVTPVDQLRLLAVDGAVQTYGLTYITPANYPPITGQFANNIVLGNGSILTFPVTEAGKEHTVLFFPVNDIFTYLPGKTVEIHTVPATAPYVVALSNASCDIPVVGTPIVGTVAVTHDLNTVVGSGTTFTALAPDDNVVFGSQLGQDVDYYIETITDNTHLTLTSSYLGISNGATTLIDLSDGFTFVPTPTVPGIPISGTASVSNGSALVVGTATTFTSILSAGQAIQFGSQEGTLYFILSITDNTHLTLETNYTGATNAATTINPPGIAPFPVVLMPGQFTDDFGTPANLTFNASAAGDTIAVSYTIRVPIENIDSVKDHPILFSGTEAGFGIEIILNNPGEFILDLPNIAFLLTEILPATTKFILTEVS